MNRNIFIKSTGASLALTPLAPMLSKLETDETILTKIFLEIQNNNRTFGTINDWARNVGTDSQSFSPTGIFVQLKNATTAYSVYAKDYEPRNILTKYSDKIDNIIIEGYGLKKFHPTYILWNSKEKFSQLERDSQILPKVIATRNHEYWWDTLAQILKQFSK